MAFGGLWHGGNSEYSNQKLLKWLCIIAYFLLKDEREMVEAYLSQKYDLAHPRKSKDTEIDNYPFKFKILAGNADGTDSKDFRVSLLDLPSIEAKKQQNPVFIQALHTEPLRQLATIRQPFAYTTETQMEGRMPTKWRRSATVGEFTDDNQDFSQTIKGLQLGTKNYYSFMVTNRGGFPVWSDTKSFETIGGLTKPSFDSITISELKYKAAVLTINVTDNGGEDPTLKLYWGNEDAGNDEFGWDNVIDLGQRSKGSSSLLKFKALKHQTSTLPASLPLTLPVRFGPHMHIYSTRATICSR